MSDWFPSGCSQVRLLNGVRASYPRSAPCGEDLIQSEGDAKRVTPRPGRVVEQWNVKGIKSCLLLASICQVDGRLSAF